MGYIKFIDEDGVLDLEDATEEQRFQIWIDLFNEQAKTEGEMHNQFHEQMKGETDGV